MSPKFLRPFQVLSQDKRSLALLALALFFVLNSKTKNYKLVELVGGGSLIKGAYPISFPKFA